MPAIPSILMDSSKWQENFLDWPNVYALLAPRVNVKGRMALVLLVAVVWAFAWLLWRAYSVIQTPNDLLVEKLGLDIPPPPSVTLEEISAREVQISWKSADAISSVHEHHIEVNGKAVGVTKKNENAAQIYNLSPSTLYDIRVFSISAGRFQTPSPVLRVRTAPANSESFVNERSSGSPAIRALAPRPLATPSSVPAPAMAREQSGGSLSRRGTLARRASPAGQESILLDGAIKIEDDIDGKLPELSLQLQELEREIQTNEAQLLDDDRDHELLLKEKEAERDELKQKLKERDEASADLRKQVHKAEAANRAALNEKSKKKHVLDQKKSQRQKRKDDMVKWDSEMGIMVDEINNIKEQTAIAERKKQNEIHEIRQRIQVEEKLLKSFEAENRDKHQEIKALEEERKQLDYEDDTEETREVDRQEQEKHRIWRDRMMGLQNHYQKIVYELSSYHQQHQVIQERLEASRRAALQTYAPVIQPDPEVFRRGPGNARQNRHASSHGSTVSSPRTAFGAVEPYSMNAHFSTTLNASPNTAGLSFFNTANGMTLMPSNPRDEILEEAEFMTGAPMSPRADLLLPADLLENDSNDELDAADQAKPQYAAANGTHEGNIVHHDNGSKSPDTTSTPRSSASPGGELAAKTEWDRASSTSPHDRTKHEESEEQSKASPYMKKQSTMSNLFHFNRQRGKTLANQPPLLGSLKPGQSQSFPRNFDEFDLSDQPRRRMSYGNNWQFPGSSLLGRGQTVHGPERISATRRAFPSFFGKSSAATQGYDPFASDSVRNDASPSRPSSVYSFERLPRVSVEGQFHAWSRNYSPLNTDWSRNQSRRPSIGYGSTSNLSLGPGPDEEYVQPRREPLRPLQAPIGTRPMSSQRAATPRLNPAAPSFSFLRRGEKSKEKAKAKEEEKRKASEAENVSPPESRRSRDSHSIATTTSTYESRESLERTTSNYSGNATPLGETAAKPTFISKITRKASSNKFGSWKGQGSLFSRKDTLTPTGTPTGADTEDEAPNTSFEHLGKSYESMSSTPGEERDKKASRSSLSSWNFMRKKQKGDGSKKDDPTASEVGESAGSERASRTSVEITTDGDDDDGRETSLH